MATKRKAKKARKSARTSGKKTRMKKHTPKKKIRKKATAKRRIVAGSRKKVGTTGRHRRKPSRSKNRPAPAVLEQEDPGLRSGGQSGDLQGLPDVEIADSESVDELIEEGNAFEAGVVDGVEHAEDDQEREVHTHEVPEDDVPPEYQDID